MALKVAELVVEIGADIDGALRGMQTVENKLAAAGRGAQSAAATLAPVAVALGAVGAVGVRAFTGYEDAVAELVARTGLAGDDLARVQALALEMGQTTQFSATQATEAMLQLVSSGQSVAEAMQTLPHVLTMASVSGLDLGTTADALTDILAMFNLKVGDSAQLVDILAAAEGASSATVADLVDAMANVGPVARTYGLSVEQTAAALSVLSENGIKGAEAGTALKSMLVNMTRPTEEVQAAWDALGTSFYDAQGNARPLPDVLADIQAGLADKTPQEANEILKNLAGSYGLVAMNALLGDLSITDMMESMADQASAATIAAAKTDTLRGRARQLQSTIEALLIRAMQPFVEKYLKPAIAVVTALARRLVEWASLHPDLMGKITLVGAAIVGFVSVLGLAGVALGVIAGLFGMLLSPITLVIAAIVALGAAWATNFLGIRDAIEGAIGWVSDLVDELKGAWEQAGWQGVGAKLLAWLLTGIGDLALWVSDNIITPLVTAIQGVDWGQVPNTLADLLASWLGWAASGLRSMGSWLWDNLLRPAINYLSNVNLAGVANRLLDLLTRFLGWGFSAIADMATWLYEHLIAPAIAYLGTVDWAAVASRLVDLLTRFIGWEFSAYVSIGTWLWEKIVQPAINYLSNVNLAGVANRLLEVLEAFLGFAGAGLASVGSWAYDNIIQPIIDTFNNAVSTVADTAKKIGEGIFNAIIEAVKGLPLEVAKVIDDAIPDKIDLGITSVDLPDTPVADLLGVAGFATGGIATRPMLATVAEREPEAIIPLSRLPKLAGGQQITVSGPVIIQGVQRPDELWRELQRAAQRRNVVFGQGAV